MVADVGSQSRCRATFEPVVGSRGVERRAEGLREFIAEGKIQILFSVNRFCENPLTEPGAKDGDERCTVINSFLPFRVRVLDIEVRLEGGLIRDRN